MRYLLVLSLLWTNVTYSQAGRIDTIKEGGVATFDGFIVDKDQMKHFRQINEEKKLLEEKTIKLEQLGIVHEQNGNWYKDNYYDLKKDYHKYQTKTSYQKFLYFVGGIVLTGFITYGTMKYSK